MEKLVQVENNRRLADPAASFGHLSQQELHLIGENAAIAEQQILRPGRRKRYRQQGHLRFVRSAVVLATVTTAAGGHHIGPDIPALARNGNDVVTGQFADRKVLATVHAEMMIAVKQGLIGQGGRPDLAKMATAHGNDRMNVELGMNATAPAYSTVGSEKRTPESPGNITPDIMGGGFFPGFPGHGTTTDVKTKHEVHGLSVSHRLLEASPKYSMKRG